MQYLTWLNRNPVSCFKKTLENSMADDFNCLAHRVAAVAGIALISGLAAPALAVADDAPSAPPPPPPPWTINAQAGYVSSKGNTDAQTANLKLDVVNQEFDNWKHELALQYVYGKQNGLATAERFDAMWQTNYKFSDRMYVFGQLLGDNDKFNGFEYQTTISAGLGYSVIKTNANVLDVQLGAGYSRSKPVTLVENTNGDVIGHIGLPVESQAVATTTIGYTHTFNASTKLINTLYAETGHLDTLVKEDLGLQVSMSKSFALTAGYEIRLNTAPPAGAERKDELVTLNLTYVKK